jgi:glucose/arabinose dehydrogenase
MPLSTKLVAAGLSIPVFATAPRGDTKRLFIVEKTGRIKILDLSTGSLKPSPFLTITGLPSGDEQGLLGLAFHPKFASNGRFYVNFTDGFGATNVRQYQVSADPDVADPASASTVLKVGQPFANHNGGCVAFGPDGLLYIGMGDGGSGNDPGNRAQNLGELLGKMLRIDVDGDDFADDPDRNYKIPSTNPFVVTAGARPEIWAYGLRNPWRFSFDRKTGDLYIGDVGQGGREEVIFQAAASTGGENYGWRIKEGTLVTGLDPVPPGVALKDPIFEYTHANGERAIIGGYVYRGAAVAGLGGTYIFGDTTGKFSSFKFDGVTPPVATSRTKELFPDNIEDLNSFGEDALGELYVCVAEGKVFRIIGTSP